MALSVSRSASVYHRNGVSVAVWYRQREVCGSATDHYRHVEIYRCFLIERYYPDVASVAAAFVWVMDTASLGFTAATFCMALIMLCVFVNDAHKWLTSARTRSASPVALEDGTAVPAPAPTPTPDVEEPAHLTLTSKLIYFTTSSYFFSRQILANDVVSSERPLLENLGSALLYILRGLEVLFAVYLVLVFVAWLKKRPGAAAPEVGAAQTPAPPVEVLFEAVDVEDEKDEKEKA